MPIQVACKCGKKMSVRDEMAGRRGKCPACGSVVEVPKKGGGVSTGGSASGAAPPAAKPASPAPSTGLKTPPPASKPSSAVSRGPLPAKGPSPSKPPAKGGSSPSKPPGPVSGKAAASGAEGGEKGGSGAASGRFCPSCKAPVGLRDIFCVGCGSSLEKREQARKGKSSDSLAPVRAARPPASPWIRAAWIGGPVVLVVAIAWGWWFLAQMGQIRQWREKQKGSEGAVARPHTVDSLLNKDWRERKKAAPKWVEDDLDRMANPWSFEVRRHAYEELHHILNIQDANSGYSPDRSWLERRASLARLRDWWEQGKARLRWDPRGRFMIPSPGDPSPSQEESEPQAPAGQDQGR